MRILCWNCCGIGNPAMVREPGRGFSSPVFCTVEMQISKGQVEGSTCTLGFQGRFAVGSDGRSGGIGVFQKRS